MLLWVLDIKYNDGKHIRFVNYDGQTPQQLEKMYFITRCCICANRKGTLTVLYPYIARLTEKANVAPMGFPVCPACIQKTTPRDLYLNIKDFFISTILIRWKSGEKTTIKSEKEFEKVEAFALKRGILKREAARHRRPIGEKFQKRRLESADLFKSLKSGECNSVYRAVLKKLDDKDK